MRRRKERLPSLPPPSAHARARAPPPSRHQSTKGAPALLATCLPAACLPACLEGAGAHRRVGERGPGRWRFAAVLQERAVADCTGEVGRLRLRTLSFRSDLFVSALRHVGEARADGGGGRDRTWAAARLQRRERASVGSGSGWPVPPARRRPARRASERARLAVGRAGARRGTLANKFASSAHKPMRARAVRKHLLSLGAAGRAPGQETSAV